MNDKLVVIVSCMGGNVANADFLRPIIDKLGMKLVAISEWPQHDVLWQRDTWLQELAKADIVICPQRYELQPAKSNNRVTQAQALGLPVIASPLQAYKEAIIHGQTGFIADSPQEWENYMRLLRDDPKLRQHVGNAAKQEVISKYSIDVIGNQWLKLLDDLCRESCNPPTVNIIIPTYCNISYLRECILSLRQCTDYPHNVIVIDSGTDETEQWIRSECPDIIYYHSPNRLHFSAANNIGISLSKAPFICLCNDDLIFSRHWLSNLMHEAVKPNVAMVGGFSNCDKHWLHSEKWEIDGIDLHPSMALDEVRPIINKIYNQRRPKQTFERDWLAFFTTLIPKYIIDKVGLLDENFKSGCEDLDYSRRIKAVFPNHRFVSTWDSVIWHAGGSTRKSVEKFDYQTHHREDRENQAYLAQKYNVPTPYVSVYQKIEETISAKSKSKPKFVLYTGAGWEKWSPKNINTTGIGGSETCAVYTAREFAKRGYESIVYGDPGNQAGIHDGVTYLPYEQFNGIEADIFISSRRADIFNLQINARKKICVIHDIWLNQDPNANINIDKIDKFFVLSPWHKEFFCNHHRVPDNKVYVTRDAIDLERFNKVLPRVPGRMIYSSSPDRGLDVLLDCLPKIRKQVPHAHLRIFYGMENILKASAVRNNPHELAWINNLKRQLQQPGVEYIGRVGQKQLAEEMLQSELWGHSTYFHETFAITAAEMMAAGVPVVTTNLAALTTTVGEAGILIAGDCRSEYYLSNFIHLCCEVLTNKNLWNDLSNRGRKKAASYDWPSLIDDWIVELSK